MKFKEPLLQQLVEELIADPTDRRLLTICNHLPRFTSVTIPRTVAEAKRACEFSIALREMSVQVENAVVIYNNAVSHGWSMDTVNEDWLEPSGRSCNRHEDCDDADRGAQKEGLSGAEHCHDAACKGCFGR